MPTDIALCEQVGMFTILNHGESSVREEKFKNREEFLRGSGGRVDCFCFLSMAATSIKNRELESFYSLVKEPRVIAESRFLQNQNNVLFAVDEVNSL